MGGHGKRGHILHIKFRSVGEHRERKQLFGTLVGLTLGNIDGTHHHHHYRRLHHNQDLRSLDACR